MVITHWYQPPHPYHDIILITIIMITTRRLTSSSPSSSTSSSPSSSTSSSLHDQAFDMLERLDPNPEYWEGKRGAAVGLFQVVAVVMMMIIIMVIRMMMMVIMIKGLAKILMTNISNHQMQKWCLFFLRWSSLEEKTDKRWQISSRYWGTLKTHRQCFF